jgi:hypothetical protein
LKNATTFEVARQFINPAGTSDFLRSDGVWHAALDNIAAHAQVNDTECPGTFPKSWLGTLRSDVGTRLSGMASALSVEFTLDGNTAIFTTSGANKWNLEGWYKAAGEEPITYLMGYQDDSAVYSGDRFARSQDWTTTAWPSSEVKQYASLPPGHYTMHVLNGGYEGNVTFYLP